MRYGHIARLVISLYLVVSCWLVAACAGLADFQPQYNDVVAKIGDTPATYAQLAQEAVWLAGEKIFAREVDKAQAPGLLLAFFKEEDPAKGNYDHILIHHDTVTITKGQFIEKAIADVGNDILTGQDGRLLELLLITEAARCKNITVSPEEVNARLSKFISGLPNIGQSQLANIPTCILQRDMTMWMLAEKLLELPADGLESRNFFNKHLDLFSHPAQAKLLCIETTTAAQASEARVRCTRGDDPKRIASLYAATAQLKACQGDIGWKTADALPPAAAAEIFTNNDGQGLQTGQYTSVIAVDADETSSPKLGKDTKVYRIYYVVDKTPARATPFTGVQVVASMYSIIPSYRVQYPIWMANAAKQYSYFVRNDLRQKNAIFVDHSADLAHAVASANTAPLTQDTLAKILSDMLAAREAATPKQTTLTQPVVETTASRIYNGQPGTHPGQECINPTDGAVMVWVPAGKFLMGDEDIRDASPQHTISLDGYWIYKYPVTEAQYRAFCEARGFAVPKEIIDTPHDEYPMIFADDMFADEWDKAKKYATWAGAMLPTEAEWEKAARGIDGRKFPWGNTWDKRKCACEDHTMNVGSFPQGASPYGCMDMAGNVLQWCEDFYQEGYYAQSPSANPTGPKDGRGHVLRGSDFNCDYQFSFRTSFRRDGYWWHNGTGFRCVIHPTMPATAPQPPKEEPHHANALPEYDGQPGDTDGQECVNPKDDAVMVWVSAGEFPMGAEADDDNADSDEKPRHTVYLDGYWIYKYNVSVAQYGKFCEATGTTMPDPPDEGWHNDHPTVNMDWEDAAKYAAWVDAQLPTEAQWEKAARGTDGRRYPWGNAFDKTRFQGGHSWDPVRLQVLEAGTVAVDAHPRGASPYGCLEMVGNINQWCADWYNHFYYEESPERNPAGPKSGSWHTFRGSSWRNHQDPRVSNRGEYTDHGSTETGFRCVVIPTVRAPR